MPPPVLAKGFRPFFLGAAVAAALLLPIWLQVWSGQLAPVGPLVGPIWHAHEMLFGFTAAVMAGFLLTAVANWTGRETLVGAPLGALAAVWLAGRVALLGVPGWPASAVDLLFLPLLTLAIARPIVAAGNRRNAGFPMLLAAMWGADLAVHLGVHLGRPDVAVAANVAALHVIVVVLLVVTGRIVPTFTRNATGAEVRSRPWLDRLAVAATLAVAVAHLVPGPSAAVPVLAGVGAVAVALRMVGWGTRHTLRDPLLWVLHLAHAWIAVGLGLEAAGGVWPVGRSIALHALTVGAIGLSTLGMMARVALGHTGRPLQAPRVMVVAFVLVLGAAVVRVVGPLAEPGATPAWLWTSGIAWAAAFALYAASYAGILTGPRADGKPG